MNVYPLNTCQLEHGFGSPRGFQDIFHFCTLSRNLVHVDKVNIKITVHKELKFSETSQESLSRVMIDKESIKKMENIKTVLFKSPQG